MEYKELIETLEELDDTRSIAYGTINWNSSDVDVRFHCTCGEEAFAFGEFVRYYKCRCGRSYASGTKFNLILLEDDMCDAVDNHGIWVEAI